MRKIFFLIFALSLPAVLRAEPDLLRPVAQDYAKAAIKAQRPRIAVLLFRYADGLVSSGSSMLSEQLSADLRTIKGIQVLDRAQVRKKLPESILVDASSPDESVLKKVGTLLQVDAVVLGVLTDQAPDKTEAATRLFRTDTGKELGSKKITVVKRTWADIPYVPSRPTN